MQKDRRSAPRVRVNLPARWQGVLHGEKATITDLSRNGCFVLSGGKVQVKELISLEIELPHRRIAHFWAEVVDEASEIGFAVKFNSSSDEDQARLESYIEEVFSTEPQKRS
jgi:PilZ domain-containing protein